jgi:hypothetical protein
MGLKPDWTQHRLGLNPGWTELRMGLNPEYGVQWCISKECIENKSIHQTISVKDGDQGLNIRVQHHIEEVGNQLLQLLLSHYSVLLPALFGISSPSRLRGIRG